MFLQMFAEAVKGSKYIYLYRVYSNRASVAGQRIAFTKDNTRKISIGADSTNTKDGMIRTPKGAEIEIEATSILAKDDEFVPALEECAKNNGLVEIWEVNLEEPATGTNQFAGTYYQGYITEIDVKSDSEDFVEISMTFGVNGKGVDGDVTVTADQQEASAYTFSDTPRVTA